MNTKNDDIATGLERLDALLAWWGLPENITSGDDGIDVTRVKKFATDLQAAIHEASCCQLDAHFAMGERLSQSLRDLAKCRQPKEAFAIQSNIVDGLLESAFAQSKVWADLVQKLNQCCAAGLHEAETENAASNGKSAKSMAKAAPSRHQKP